MDAVFQALAHEGRRRILDILKERPGCSVGDVCAQFEMSRIAVMKNIRVLEDARLIASEKRGRTRRLFMNAVPIRMIYERWLTEYSALWAERLTRIKYRVEGEAAAGKGTKSRRKTDRTSRRKKDTPDG